MFVLWLNAYERTGWGRSKITTAPRAAMTITTTTMHHGTTVQRWQQEQQLQHDYHIRQLLGCWCGKSCRISFLESSVFATSVFKETSRMTESLIFVPRLTFRHIWSDPPNTRTKFEQIRTNSSRRAHMHTKFGQNRVERSSQKNQTNAKKKSDHVRRQT